MLGRNPLSSAPFAALGKRAIDAAFSTAGTASLSLAGGSTVQGSTASSAAAALNLTATCVATSSSSSVSAATAFIANARLQGGTIAVAGQTSLAIRASQVTLAAIVAAGRASARVDTLIRVLQIPGEAMLRSPEIRDMVLPAQDRTMVLAAEDRAMTKTETRQMEHA